MFELSALYLIIFMSAVTSLMGAKYIVSGAHIFDLRITTRNFMHIGACCAMTFGFLAATYSIGLQTTTLWHYLAATALCVIGLFATAHIVIDLSDRLRIDKRNKIQKEVKSNLSPAPKAQVYDLCLYRANLNKKI